MKFAEVKSILKSDADVVGRKRNGNIIARRGFFYRHGYSAEAFANKISSILADAEIKYTIIDKGEHWTAFRGGAKVVNSSHWWVEISVIEEV